MTISTIAPWLYRHWRTSVVMMVVAAALGIHLTYEHTYDVMTYTRDGSTPRALLTIGSTTMPVFVADTPARIYKGLSDRDDLGLTGGMLFVFPTVATRTFVMRAMRFPLDFIWISQGHISDLQRGAPLEPFASEEQLTRYTGRFPVDMVLEVPSGTVDGVGWRIGDSVTVQY